MRIMGKGRVGVGYKRWSHVTIKVAPIDFQKRIREADNIFKKSEWIRRQRYTKEARFRGQPLAIYKSR